MGHDQAVTPEQLLDELASSAALKIATAYFLSPFRREQLELWLKEEFTPLMKAVR